MDKLRSQSKSFTYLTILISATVYFALKYNFVYFKNLIDESGLFGLSWTLIPLAIIMLYERIGWKLINRKIDFSGYWDFTEDQYIFDEGKQAIDYSSAGSMCFVQTTSAIGIVNGITIKETDPVVEVSRWWSSACELDAEKGIITAALDHASSPYRIGGAVQYGVEIFSVTHRDHLEVPTGMSSTVFHCIGYGTPRIVAVKYKRRKKPLLTKLFELIIGGRHGKNR